MQARNRMGMAGVQAWPWPCSYHVQPSTFAGFFLSSLLPSFRCTRTDTPVAPHDTAGSTAVGAL